MVNACASRHAFVSGSVDTGADLTSCVFLIPETPLSCLPYSTGARIFGSTWPSSWVFDDMGSRTSTARHPAVLQLRCMDGFAGYVYSRRKPIKVYVWHCSHCKEELDDGFLKMIACDHCLEWVCRTEQDITADDTACRGFQPLVPTSSRIYVARKTIHASHLKYCWMARRGARLPIVKHPRMDTPIHTRLLRQSSFPSRLSVLVHAVYLPSPLISTELPYSVLTRVLAKFHSIPTHSRKIDYLLIKISNN